MASDNDRASEPEDGETGMSAEITDFDGLLSLHRHSIVCYVRSLLPGYPGSEDVAQEVMLTIWKKRRDFEIGSNFKAWAFRIAHFHVLNQRRKIARGKWLVFDEEVLDRLNPSAAVKEFDELSEEQEALEECMSEVSGENRQLLETRYATKTSIETFAEQTGQRPGTLKARLFRLRASLRDCIKKRLGSK